MTLTERTPDMAQEQLKAGNRRFIEGKCKFVDWQEERGRTHIQQAPIAAVLTCSDSRVCPEIVFDQTLGDLFVIRVAGNLIDAPTFASLEFAVAELHVPLIVILTHEQCAAVLHACNTDYSKHSYFTEQLTPFIQQAKAKNPIAFAKDPCTTINKEHADAIYLDLLKNSSIIASKYRDKKVRILSGQYQMLSGDIDWWPSPHQN